MSDSSQRVPIGHVNSVKQEGPNVLVSLMTMGRSLTFVFDPSAAQDLLMGFAAVARQQSEEVMAFGDKAKEGAAI